MTAIERLIGNIPMTPIPQDAQGDGEGLPFATHQGLLKIGEAELLVYQLNTGQRVIEQSSLAKFFGVSVEELQAGIGRGLSADLHETR